MSRRDPTIRELLAGRDVLCPKCKYNLRGLDAGMCPECGFGFDAGFLRSLLSPRVRVVYWTIDHAFVVLCVAWVGTSLLTARVVGDGTPWDGLARAPRAAWLGAICGLLLLLSKLAEGVGDWLWQDRFMAAAAVATAVRLALVLWLMV